MSEMPRRLLILSFIIPQLAAESFDAGAGSLVLQPDRSAEAKPTITAPGRPPDGPLQLKKDPGCVAHHELALDRAMKTGWHFFFV